MYLSELKLWNFRKYGIQGSSFDNSEPGITVSFQEGVNVLVGENDSGKTSIVDAIRYVLRTQSLEYIQIDEKDFHKGRIGERATELKIECTFSGFSNDGSDAGHFLEWIGFNSKNEFELKVWLYAKRKDDNFIYQQTRAGIDSEGTYMEGEARNLLRVIYLKPLRDALTEMTQGNRSRFAQILKSLQEFKKKKKKNHPLEDKYDAAKTEIDGYFDDPNGGKEIIDTINTFLNKDFFVGSKQERENKKAVISLAENELSEILKQLNLILEDNKSGLGSLNLLYIAAELLHLKKDKPGLKLTIIEELEAHLHPQFQLRLIDFIQENEKPYGQFILTTHSTTLASSIKLENLIVCKGTKVFPMGSKFTLLEKDDYRFLERFLDATKANLFFAKGVIIVEGDAENILIPTIAKLINRPLHQYGVSIVNVGSTAFNRYRKIFIRKRIDKPIKPEDWLDTKVSVVTDLDIPSMPYWTENGKTIYWIEDIEKLKEITEDIDWENLLGTVITSKSEFKKLYKANKNDTRKKLGKGIPDKLESIFSTFEKTPTKKIIRTLREDKGQKIEKQINCQNIKGFIPKQWTLEYDIAKSKLYKELAMAIEMARTISANHSLILNHELIEEIKEKINRDYNDKENNSATAYQIFKPLLNGSVSKAATAQCLSEILEQKKPEILSDIYLKYICDAIIHVTEPIEMEGGEEDEE